MNVILELLLRIVRFVIDKISDVIYFVLYEIVYRDFSYTRLPPLPEDELEREILTSAAAHLVHMLKEGRVSSEKIVDTFIRRIEKINPLTNCIVDARFEAAKEDARRVDAEIAAAVSSSSGRADSLFEAFPLLGIPFTAKDCFNVKGLSWSVGLAYRAKEKGDGYADAVRAMMDAGAIPLAVTNVSELCLWMESSNKVYGRTMNPYHRGRTVGGSSGGEGCALTAAASVVGIGSDVGGSIRMPAFFCGIYGHKATGGVISNKGQLPKAHGVVDREMLLTGPMCRYVEDLLPLTKIMTGPEKALELRLGDKVDVRRLRVFYMEDDGGCPLVSPVNKELRDAQADLVGRLRSEYGVAAHRVNLRGFYHSFRMWNSRMDNEKEQRLVAEEMVPEGSSPPNLLLEMAKSFVGRSVYTFPILVVALTEKLSRGRDPLSEVFLKKTAAFAESLDTLLGDDGVLLYPSHSTPAPYHRQPVLKTFNFSYTAVFNATGHPVTQCPLGVGAGCGVPLGIQVVGARHMDRNTLAMAAAIDKMFGGWVPPPMS